MQLNNYITLLYVGDYSTKNYRVKLFNSRRHVQFSYSQVITLIQSGQIDLDDQIALANTEEWFYVWELEQAFEPAVINAYMAHINPIIKMRKTIAGNWRTTIQFRDERDDLLMQEPGVKDSNWAARPRPDLIKCVVGHELHADAAIGAARQAMPHTMTQLSQHSMVSGEIFRENIIKIFQGDLPEWADPKALLASAKSKAATILYVSFCITLFTDPVRPWMPLWGIVLSCGVYAIYAALRQLACDGRIWVDQFIAFILYTLVFSVFLVVTLKCEPRHGCGILARIPLVANLQEKFLSHQ